MIRLYLMFQASLIVQDQLVLHSYWNLIKHSWASHHRELHLMNANMIILQEFALILKFFHSKVFLLIIFKYKFLNPFPLALKAKSKSFYYAFQIKKLHIMLI